MRGTLELLGMKFHAYHGCLESERISGNTFIVDFKAQIDMDKASKSDDLNDTLDYSIIYNIVKREMEIPSNLLEHVAGRILRSIESACPGIPQFSITVTKENPPVDGPTVLSRVTLYHQDNE